MSGITSDVAGALAVADDPEALGPALLHLLGSPRVTVLDKEQNVRLGRRFRRSLQDSRLWEEEAPPGLMRLRSLHTRNMAVRGFSTKRRGASHSSLSDCYESGPSPSPLDSSGRHLPAVHVTDVHLAMNLERAQKRPVPPAREDCSSLWRYTTLVLCAEYGSARCLWGHRPL
jgi:hypothetical protein